MTRFFVKHLRTNSYTHDEEEVPEGTQFGFWRVCEQVSESGLWFPHPGLYDTREAAERVAERWRTAKGD